MKGTGAKRIPDHIFPVKLKVYTAMLQQIKQQIRTRTVCTRPKEIMGRNNSDIPCQIRHIKDEERSIKRTDGKAK